MRNPFFLAVLSISLCPAALFADEGVPAQLRNKTIRVAWTAQRTVMTPRGEKQPPRFDQQRIIYVSSAGNFFIKAMMEGLRGERQAEMAPGDKTARGGEREVQFVQGKLVAMAQKNSGGVGRMVISFDPSYSTCSVDVTFGRPAGEKTLVRNGKGVPVELLGVAISGQRCSIEDGNAFAN